MSLSGWVKLYRALSDHYIASDPNALSVWIHLLMLANHTEAKRLINGRVVVVLPGQILTSRKSLSAKTGVQESKVERILSMLKNEQQIEQHGTTKFRLISIRNWHEYQSGEQQIEQQMNSGRTANEQQMNTLEECKEGEECKEDKSSTKTIRRNWLKELVAQGVKEAHAKDWLAVRKLKKASNTDTAMNAVKAEATKAGISFGEAVRISAENSWSGFKASWLEQTKTSSDRPVNRQQQIEDANQAVVLEIAERERLRRLAEQARDPQQDDFIGTGDTIIEGEYIHAK